MVLGAAGLYSLQLTHERTTEALARLDDLHSARVAAIDVQVHFKSQVQEWKNLLLRSRTTIDYTNHLTTYERQHTAVRASLKELETRLGATALDAATVAPLAAEHAKLNAAYRAALADYVPGNPGTVFATDAAVHGIARDLDTRIDALADTINAAIAEAIAETRADSDRRYTELRTLVAALSAATLLLALTLAFLALRRTT